MAVAKVDGTFNSDGMVMHLRPIESRPPRHSTLNDFGLSPFTIIGENGVK
jgi:hypothetical protein